MKRRAAATDLFGPDQHVSRSNLLHLALDNTSAIVGIFSLAALIVASTTQRAHSAMDLWNRNIFISWRQTRPMSVIITSFLWRSTSVGLQLLPTSYDFS
jgi:hypothetical protein